MEGYSREDAKCPHLLDLIPKEREWLVKRELGETNHGLSEEQKLELRLGPPGGDWTTKNGSKNNSRERDESFFSLGYYPNTTTTNSTSGAKRGFMETVNGYQVKSQEQQKNASFLHPQSTSQSKSLPVITMESSQPLCTKGLDLQQSAEKKAFLPASANTAVPNSAQKRTAPAPVVGWPPIRSFRKNLATSSSAKPASDSQNVVPNKATGEKLTENSQKSLFVKINMDGIPIGRKVDLKAYDSYEKLSSAVDELFRGLLAAQNDPSVGAAQKQGEREKAITGLLDGSGEYTFVYEDNEGDRMLVGDVPWHMFLSTVKRLRVLKSSELPTLSRGPKQAKP